MVDLAQSISKVCQPHAGPKDSPGMAASCSAFLEWADVVQRVCSAKSLQIMLANPTPKVPWNYQKMLPAEYYPLAMSLQKASNIQDRLVLLKQDSPDLEEGIKDLALVETVWSALGSSCLSKDMDEVDPMFRDTKARFTEFVEAYTAAMQKGLTDFEETHFPSFQNFNHKFEPVVQAAEKWQMGPVAWAFTDQYEQTKEALEQLMAAKDNVRCLMEAIKSLCGHNGSFKALVDLVNQAKGLYKNAHALVTEADMTAGILMMGCVLYNGSSAKDAKATFEMAHSSFGTKKENLPAKMQRLYADLVKDKDANVKGEEAAKPPPGTPKGAPRKRKTTATEDRKPAAKEKSERKGKDKEPKEKKEKKSRRKEKGSESEWGGRFHLEMWILLQHIQRL